MPIDIGESRADRGVVVRWIVTSLMPVAAASKSAARLKARSVMMELAYLEKVDPSRRMMRLYAILDRPDPLWRMGHGTGVGRVGSPGRLRESWFATEKIASWVTAVTRFLMGDIIM